MSYKTWHNYGFGVCTDDISESNVGRLQSLLALAPRFRAKVESWLAEQEITDPTWEDYTDYDEDFHLGIVAFLKEVIEEAEGIILTACGDYNSACYLIYSPSYPWELSDADRNLTEDRLREIFTKYIGVLTDKEIEVSYQEVENGC